MLCTLIRSVWREWKFAISERYYLYSDSGFQVADKELRKLYKMKNPYRVAKTFFHATKTSPLYSYGETPLLTAFYLMKAGGISTGDVVVDLGAGAGRLSLFVSFFFPVHSIAYEINPCFCSRLSRIKEKMNLNSLEVIQGDFIQDRIPRGTVYYLCQLFLTEDQLKILLDKILSQTQYLKVITVSLEINDFRLSLYHKETGEFLWGDSEVFFYERMV